MNQSLLIWITRLREFSEKHQICYSRVHGNTTCEWHKDDIGVTYGWHTSTYQWHTYDIRVHTSDIRMTYEYIWVTYEDIRATYRWHTSTCKWHTNVIRVHTSDIRMIHEYIPVTYKWHGNDMRMTRNFKPYKVFEGFRSQFSKLFVVKTFFKMVANGFWLLGCSDSHTFY